MFEHPLLRARQIALRNWLMAIDLGQRQEEAVCLEAKRLLDEQIRRRCQRADNLAKDDGHA